MAQVLPDPMWILLVWLVAGGLSLIGAMINAEIGSMFPETGGQFVYFKEMYGHRFAFVYGWAGLAVINTAAVSAIAFVFAQYFSFFIDLPNFSADIEKSWHFSMPFVGTFYPLENFGVKMIAALCVLVLTAFNHYSLNTGNAVQLLFTWLKVALLLLIVFLVFSLEMVILKTWRLPAKYPLQFSTLLAFVAALSGAFAAFDGWNNLGFVAGELKNPEKSIPKSPLAWSTHLFCPLRFYPSCLLLQPGHRYRAAASSLIATDAVEPVLGKYGAAFIAIMVMISTFGAVNGNILACARLTFSMGENKDFFHWAGKVHPKHNTPSNALWFHALISIAYIFTGSFDMLADLFVFVTWIFYGFGAWGLIILRKNTQTAQDPTQSNCTLPTAHLCLFLYTLRRYHHLQ